MLCRTNSLWGERQHKHLTVKLTFIPKCILQVCLFELLILTQLVHRVAVPVQGINHSDTLARGKSQRLYSGLQILLENGRFGPLG